MEKGEPMKYIVMTLLTVYFIMGVCTADIIDTGLPRGDYSDEGINRQLVLMNIGQLSDPTSIKITTDTQEIVTE